MIRSTEPNEITARWIVSTTLAALSSGAMARMFSPFSGTQNRSQRNSSGTTTNRKMPTMARSARDREATARERQQEQRERRRSRGR